MGRVKSVKSENSFHQRLMQHAQDAKLKAQKLKPGPERDTLLKKIEQLQAACEIEEWLSSPRPSAP